jgi:hypothetical protein
MANITLRVSTPADGVYSGKRLGFGEAADANELDIPVIATEIMITTTSKIDINFLALNFINKPP